MQNTFCVEAVNGDSTPSPNHVAARPKNTPVPKPLEAQPVNSTGKNERVMGTCSVSLFYLVVSEVELLFLYSLCWISEILKGCF